MPSDTIYQISLIAAFVAGMVALFAPCCITYLLPAYLGNVFKEKRHVLLMTLVYSLGIFTVMIPVVLGAKALSSLFFQLHNQTYLVGGSFMIVVAILAFLGVKLPMINLSMNQSKNRVDFASTFTLGIFSGITSACCAPVLIGVITLSSLSPSLLLSLGVGAAYVLGMVTPLYLASLFIDQRNILAKPILKKQLTTLNLGNKTYPIFVSNVVAGLVFALTGLAMITLTLTGNLGMSVAETQVIRTINNVALSVTSLTNNFGLNLIFILVTLYLLYKLIRRSLKKP